MEGAPRFWGIYFLDFGLSQEEATIPKYRRAQSWVEIMGAIRLSLMPVTRLRSFAPVTFLFEYPTLKGFNHKSALFSSPISTRCLISFLRTHTTFPKPSQPCPVIVTSCESSPTITVSNPSVIGLGWTVLLGLKVMHGPEVDDQVYLHIANSDHRAP